MATILTHSPTGDIQLLGSCETGKVMLGASLPTLFSFKIFLVPAAGFFLCLGPSDASTVAGAPVRHSHSNQGSTMKTMRPLL